MRGGEGSIVQRNEEGVICANSVIEVTVAK